MKVHNLVLVSVVAAATLTMLPGCAHRDKHSTVTDANIDDTSSACVRALSDLGYKIVNTDKDAGIITAERVLDGAASTGRTFTVQVAMREFNDGTAIKVTFHVPSGTFGSSDAEFRELISALEGELPDAEFSGS